MTTHPTETIWARYDLGEMNSFSAMTSGYSNQSYKVETEKGAYLYRVYKKQDMDSVRREIELLNALSGFDFPAAFPIRRTDGAYINPTGEGPVVIYQFIAGEEPGLNPETVVEAARAVARLNSFPDWERFRLNNDLTIENCAGMIDDFKDAPCQYPDIFEYFVEQTEYLTEPMSIPLPEGLIHGDIFPDNTIYQGNRLAALIDFEDSCTDRLVHDVGMTINGFCCPGNKLDMDLLALFITAYTHVRPLSDMEFELLPCYIQMGAHAMIYWHLKYDLLNHPDARQLARVQEHIDRVRALRETRLPDLKHMV